MKYCTRLSIPAPGSASHLLARQRGKIRIRGERKDEQLLSGLALTDFILGRDACGRVLYRMHLPQTVTFGAIGMFGGHLIGV